MSGKVTLENEEKEGDNKRETLEVMGRGGGIVEKPQVSETVQEQAPSAGAVVAETPEGKVPILCKALPAAVQVKHSEESATKSRGVHSSTPAASREACGKQGGWSDAE